MRINYDTEPVAVGAKVWIDDYGPHNDWGKKDPDARLPIEVEVLLVTDRDYDEDYPARYILRSAAGIGYERSEDEAWPTEIAALKALEKDARHWAERHLEDSVRSARSAERYAQRLAALEGPKP